MGKIKNRIETKQDIKYLTKQRDELARIVTEIESENCRILPPEKIEAIIKGRKGRLEEASKLQSELRKENFKRVSLKSVKGLVTTLNITMLLLPYALIGTPTYFIQKAFDNPPYHQNTNKEYAIVTEYQNSDGEKLFLDEEEIEKYGEHSLIISTPYEESSEGYVRNIFELDDLDEDVNLEEIVKTDPTKLIVDNTFEDSDTETVDTLPEGENKFTVEATNTYEDKENFTIKENSKGKIIVNSIIHFSITAVLGTLILAGSKFGLKKKGRKYLFDNQVDGINEELALGKSKTEKKAIKSKIKDLRK